MEPAKERENKNTDHEDTGNQDHETHQNVVEPAKRENSDTTYRKPASPHAFRQTGIAQILPLSLRAACRAESPECVKVADFAQVGAECDDGEADPETPDYTAEDCYNFVAE